MSAMILPKKKDSDFYVVYPKKGEPVSGRIDFDECYFQLEGDTLNCFFHPISSDMYALKDKETNDQWTDGKPLFMALKKGDSAAADLIIETVSAMDLSACYTGFINVNTAVSADVIKLAKAALVPEMIQVGVQASPQHLKQDALKAPASSGGGKQYKTPEQRALEKLAALKAIVASADTGGVLEGLAAFTGEPLTGEQKLNVLLAICG